MEDRRIKIERTGTILHLDGDKKYAEKSKVYYKRMGLNAIVKNISEKEQAEVITDLLNQFEPDILIITGHDKMIKKGKRYYDICNYQNSKHFINTVLKARKWEHISGKEITIFAGACQSFYEAIMKSGANFASSPGRILIDFEDPLIVAKKIATTEKHKYISIEEISKFLRDGTKGVGGIRKQGKKRSNNTVI
ncbi:MAG: hypothetical protein IKP28_02940 [Clostridia bacterium]|nr:hypothetical protein [Clostridia bacterium]